ncbi:MAG: cysteine hydrolase [Clostridia bacterium]|jgi:nicotinamidase-related amidase|nr:cysteine hydrolase [Clostridia bacterium]
MKKALILIDVQNDYFEGGKFPLWNVGNTLDNIVESVKKAKENDIEVVLIQHVADENGPFFNESSEGVKLHEKLLTVAGDAEVVIKTKADSFYNTNLEELLSSKGIEELFVAGMMTQNCVTHTAISKSAEKYKVSMVADLCTTVSEPIHFIGLDAVTTRIDVITKDMIK